MNGFRAFEYCVQPGCTCLHRSGVTRGVFSTREEAINSLHFAEGYASFIEGPSGEEQVYPDVKDIPATGDEAETAGRAAYEAL